MQFAYLTGAVLAHMQHRPFTVRSVSHRYMYNRKQALLMMTSRCLSLVYICVGFFMASLLSTC